MSVKFISFQTLNIQVGKVQFLLLYLLSSRGLVDPKFVEIEISKDSAFQPLRYLCNKLNCRHFSYYTMDQQQKVLNYCDCLKKMVTYYREFT